jgi:hypothetical protein
MTVIASITTSVDGYITGPNDGPGNGLGDGGERLHYWVFGGPWSYADGPRGEPAGVDAEYLTEAMSRVGAVVGGRGTYEEEPEDGEFAFVDGVEAGVARAIEAAGGKDVSVMGGADVIRQALAGGLVDQLTIIVAPVILGEGKALFDGFTHSLDLEHVGVRQSALATFIDYEVKKP